MEEKEKEQPACYILERLDLRKERIWKVQNSVSLQSENMFVVLED